MNNKNKVTFDGDTYDIELSIQDGYVVIGAFKNDQSIQNLDDIKVSSNDKVEVLLNGQTYLLTK